MHRQSDEFFRRVPAVGILKCPRVESNGITLLSLRIRDEHSSCDSLQPIPYDLRHPSRIARAQARDDWTTYIAECMYTYIGMYAQTTEAGLFIRSLEQDCYTA